MVRMVQTHITAQPSVPSRNVKLDISAARLPSTEVEFDHHEDLKKSFLIKHLSMGDLSKPGLRIESPAD